MLHSTLLPVHHSFPTAAAGSSAAVGSAAAVGSGSRWFDSPVVRYRFCLSPGLSNLRCVIVETRPLDASKRPLGEATRAGVVVDQPELQALDL